MIQVQVRCPACKKIGYIQVEENIVGKSLRGITAVNIAEFFICEHSFIAYVDKNFKVRDCYITDFKIELPDITFNRDDGKQLVKENFKDVDIYIITLNINILILSYILNCFFRKRKVLFLNILDILKLHLTGFFNHIFKDSFDYDFTIMSKDLYKKNKKDFKEHVILDNEKIINDKYKYLKPNNVKVELMILRKFLKEDDPSLSMIILRNEIFKAFKFSKLVLQFVKSLDKKTPLNATELKKHVLISYPNITIEKSYLAFLMDIVRNYCGENIKDASTVLSKL